MNQQSTFTPSATTGSTTPSDSSTGNPGALSDAKNSITSTARDAAAKLKTATASTVAKAKDQAAQLAAEKKAAASERIGGYSSALHDSAKSFEQNDPNIAWFTHRAADKLQGVADYMRSRDFSGLRQDAEGLARRHPGAFFGGLFLAGLLIGNVVKASQRKAANSGDNFRAPRDPQDNESNGGEGHYDDLAPSPALTAAEREAAGL